MGRAREERRMGKEGIKRNGGKHRVWSMSRMAGHVSEGSAVCRPDSEWSQILRQKSLVSVKATKIQWFLNTHCMATFRK